MTFRDFWRREIWVARHGQPRSFRIRKWLVIFALAAVLFYFFGWKITLLSFLACAALGLWLHFVLRFMTDGWKKDWGPYKRIKLDGE